MYPISHIHGPLPSQLSCVALGKVRKGLKEKSPESPTFEGFTTEMKTISD